MDKNNFLIDLSESASSDFGRVDFSNQSDAQQVFSAIWELESQINNGGFDQYFRNSETDIILNAPTALRTIGASKCAAIVESAINLLSPFPSDRDTRADALDDAGDEVQDQLDALDTQFFAYPDDITALLFSFVATQAGEFGEMPDPANDG